MAVHDPRCSRSLKRSKSLATPPSAGMPTHRSTRPWTPRAIRFPANPASVCRIPVRLASGSTITRTWRRLRKHLKRHNGIQGLEMVSSGRGRACRTDLPPRRLRGGPRPPRRGASGPVPPRQRPGAAPDPGDSRAGSAQVRDRERSATPSLQLRHGVRLAPDAARGGVGGHGGPAHHDADPHRDIRFEGLHGARRRRRSLPAGGRRIPASARRRPRGQPGLRGAFADGEGRRHRDRDGGRLGRAGPHHPATHHRLLPGGGHHQLRHVRSHLGERTDPPDPSARTPGRCRHRRPRTNPSGCACRPWWAPPRVRASFATIAPGTARHRT